MTKEIKSIRKFSSYRKTGNKGMRRGNAISLEWYHNIKIREERKTNGNAERMDDK